MAKGKHGRQDEGGKPPDIRARVRVLATHAKSGREAMDEWHRDGRAILRTVRKEILKLNLRDMADRLGVHFTYLSKMENEKMEISWPLLEKLDVLLNGKGSK
jgi:DNA-binding XRE family transcriptional regulator